MSNNNDEFTWTDNPTVSGVSACNTDVLNECLMHLKYNNEGTGSGFSLFDVVQKDHVLSLEESKGFAPLGSFVYKESASSARYGYPDFYAKCLEEKADGLEVELQLEENTITVYKNMNGHVFYDIADKDAVDLYYTHNDACWMYGVDEENERIFLPRKTLYDIEKNIPVVGNGKTLGMTNGTNNAGIGTGGGQYDRATLVPDFYGANLSTSGQSGGVSGIWGVTTDPEKSGLIADFSTKTDDNFYLYMVVGNTEVTEAQTSVTEITTSENDTIPLFTAQYFDFTPNNASWLKAGTQKNSGGIYTTAYNTLVACLTDNTYNIKVVDVTNMTAGVDYSEYWKVDQTAMTFTTPTSISNKALTGAVVGNGMAMGLTDGTNNAGLWWDANVGGNDNIDAYGVSIGRNVSNNPELSFNNKAVGITTDPEKSGIIAEESSIAQLYFKVANAVENLELLDAGEVLEAVANKVDMTNTQWATSACMPDYSAGVDISESTIVNGFTAPIDGVIYHSGSGDADFTINGFIVGSTYHSNYANYQPVSFYLSGGDLFKKSQNSSEFKSCIFFPMKGANNA